MDSRRAAIRLGALVARSSRPARIAPSPFRSTTLVVPALQTILYRRHYSSESPASNSVTKAVLDATKPPPPPEGPAKLTGTDAVSKIIKEAAEEAKAEASLGVAANQAEKRPAEKKEEPKLTLWQKVKKELAHYRDGTKLLAMEVRISSKLALKMSAGYELTRREHRQLQRTVRDLGRLVPFAMFVIVPFAELLLPVALKLFPNLLPSTYEGQKDKDKKAAKLRATRNEVSSFLRQTLKESGLPMTVTAANAKKEEFTEFFRKVRSSGEDPTPEEVIQIGQIFKDDITLDNLSRPQLVAICRYMGLNSIGMNNMLRYQIRHHMRKIKADDRAISYEGVASLSVPELQMANAQRGLPTLGMSPARLRDDLQTWLDLRLKYNLPSTLLVLSNAFVYAKGSQETEILSQIDALADVLSSIPEELFHEIELEVHHAEGAATNKQRLEVLKEQEELIEEENAQSQPDQDGDAQPATVSDRENIDEKDETTTTSTTGVEPGEGAEAVEAKEAEGEAAKVEEKEKEKAKADA